MDYPQNGTGVLKNQACGTLCIPGQVCLLSRNSLVLLCVVRLYRDRRAALFLSYTVETETKLVPLWKTPGFALKIPNSCLSGKPLVLHLRYAFQVLQIGSQFQNPGNYRNFNLIQGSIITLAHSDEAYTQNYGKIMETPIPRTRACVEDAGPQNPLPHL